MNKMLQRVLSLMLVAAFGIAAPLGLWAQEARVQKKEVVKKSSEGADGEAVEVKVEMRDGKRIVWVNGKEVEPKDGKVVIITKDGKERVINIDADQGEGAGVWVSDDGRERDVVIRTRRGDGPSGIFRSRGEDGPLGEPRRFRMRRDGDGEGHDVFFFSDGEGGAFEFDQDRVFMMDDMRRGEEMMMARRMAEEGHAEMMKERMEIARMDRESMVLARKARQAEGEERQKLDAELDALLADIFQRKQAMMQANIDRLNDRLAAERAKVAERERERAQIIEHRKRRLLGQDEASKW